MKMYRCIVVKGGEKTNKKTEFFPPKTQIFYNRPQLPPPGVISKSNTHNKIKMPNNTYVSTAIYNQFNRQSLSISDAPSDRRQGAAGTVPPAKGLRSQWRGRHIHMADSLTSGTRNRGFWASPLDAAQAAAFDVSQTEYLVSSLKTCLSLPSSTVPMSNREASGVTFDSSPCLDIPSASQ